MAVVAGSLIAAEANHTACILEHLRRRNDSVNNADRSRAKHHARAGLCHCARLFVSRIGKMDSDHIAIQIVFLQQPRDRSHPIAHFHLLGLSRPLRKVHVDLRIVFYCQLFDAVKHLLADKVRALRTVHHMDTAIRCSIPAVECIHRVAKRLLAKILVVAVQFSRRIDQRQRLTHADTDVAANAQLFDIREQLRNIVSVFTDRRSTVEHSLRHAKHASRCTLLICAVCAERTRAVHHPVAYILCNAAHRAHACMHMCIDQTGQHQIIGCINDFLSRILAFNISSRCNSEDLSLIDRHSEIFAVANTFTCHRIHMMRQDEHIHLFHSRSPFYNWPIKNSFSCAKHSLPSATKAIKVGSGSYLLTLRPDWD